MNQEPIFTRYLYIKEEVAVALLASLLNKDKDQALFWAYELHYSGFTQELLDILWRLYFEFYAVLNPALAVYLLAKQKENEKTPIMLIAIIINNLIIRKFNLDVFFLKEVACNFEADPDDLPPLSDCFALNNYEAIAHYIIETEDDKEIVDLATAYFQGHNINMSKLFKKHSGKSVLIARIMHCYMLIHNKAAIGKNLYVIVEPADLVIYETISISTPRKLLPMAVRYSVDYYHMLYLFKKERGPMILKQYYNDWLYYASFSPIWIERIEEHSGTINHDTKNITFADETDEDTFNDHYWYEPDEQAKIVQERNIPSIRQTTWGAFFAKYQGTGTRTGLYMPDSEYLSNF